MFLEDAENLEYDAAVRQAEHERRTLGADAPPTDYSQWPWIEED